ncbi:MAG: hypothetical protein N3D14_03535 [Aquificaceae bacterium]|nr:hypothetical protein [Aquificaceae bacterium]
MNTKELINVLILSDLQLPVGGFVYSWGLESYIYSGFEIGSVIQVIKAYIEEGPLESELYACKAAYSSFGKDGEIAKINQIFSAMKYLPASHNMSIKLGKNLLRFAHFTLKIPIPDEPKHIHYPIAFGYVGRFLEIDLKTLLTTYAHTSVKALMNALLRCYPFSVYDAWAFTIDMSNQIESVVKKSLNLKSWTKIYINTLLWDLYIHKHKFHETRLFEG